MPSPRVLLALAILFLFAALASQRGGVHAGPPEAVRKDRYGDPLPPGALARVGTVRFRHEDTVCSVAFSPDGKTVATSDDVATRLWELPTGKGLRRTARLSACTSLAFAGGGRAVVGRDRQGTVSFWDLTGEKKSATVALEGKHSCLAVSPDGKVVALLREGATALVFLDAASRKKLGELKCPAGGLHQLVYSADGATLAGVGRGGAFVWDLAAGKVLCRVEAPCPQSVALSPDGKTLAGRVLGRSEVHFWNTETGRGTRTLRVSDDSPRHLAFSPNGKVLALASRHVLRLWEADSGKELWHYTADRGQFWNQFWDVSFSPDSKRVAAAISYMVRLWDVASGKEICPVPEHRDPVVFLALSADGKTLITEAATTACRESSARGRTTATSPCGHGTRGRANCSTPRASRAASRPCWRCPPTAGRWPRVTKAATCSSMTCPPAG